MKNKLSGRRKNGKSTSLTSKEFLSLDTVEVKVFQNSNNKQFNLPVLKKHTSPKILNDILGNKNVVGLKFKITDVIFKKQSKGKGGKV